MNGYDYLKSLSDFEKITIDNEVLNVKDASVREPTFTESTTRSNINSGESIFVILGKIKKYFSDVKL